ncbi:hypothetical protein C8A03DRAFT_38930 [Achaetomium macrosporum]|uniref:Tyrosinase copper-binding domain-containing protein n=1 Tax=Achaetomium macrosporum TaxID=79813 RepID=A0AAN7C2K4_9PEZI|nr:hypothetical protein C8A03DRAFT_38930 [Achaetomium macrosporum]
MKLFSMLMAASAIVLAAARPANQPRQRCTSPSKRIEWRQLTAADRQSYIKAVLCLKTKPSRMGLSTPLYDDFAHLHFKLSNYIHGGPPFLPWHRYFVHVHENALRECGYQGAGTYWDWTLDTAGLRHSPVMSAETGFGGNGSLNRTETSPAGRTLQCVDSGPFSHLRPEYLALDPKNMVNFNHCLWRDLPEVSEPQAFETMAASFGPANVAELQTAGNWTYYSGALEGGPHGTIHASLGGEMNPTTSPNEPLFFLHHAQIDRLWWLWQQQDPSRLSEYNGEASHFNETGSREVSLDDMLLMGGIEDDVTVREVMDVQGDRLCYTY